MKSCLVRGRIFFFLSLIYRYTQFDDDSSGESKIQFDMNKSLNALKKRFDRHGDKDIDDDDDDDEFTRLDHAGFKAFVLELSPMLYVSFSLLMYLHTHTHTHLPTGPRDKLFRYLHL